MARAEAAHLAEYGRSPSCAGAAPGRVNLIGEHTDYSGGLVLPIAIDRWCVVAVSAGPGGRVRVWASDVGERAEFDGGRAVEPAALRGGGQPGWLPYVGGVVEHVRRVAEHRGMGNGAGLDLTIASSVARGAGVASSAALEVSVAMGLSAAQRLGLTGPEAARIGRRAEHEFAGVPCGIMDQLVSATGRRGCGLLIDCRAETTRAIPLPPEGESGAAIMLVDSGLRHGLPDGAYAAKVAACDSAARALGVRELRDATMAQVEGAAGLSDEERRAATHVVGENARVEAFVETLEGALAATSPDWPAALDRLGWLMMESHASLRHTYRVSCRELDALVDLAMLTPGVFGARLTGAGFGGSVVALVRADAAASFQERIERGYRAKVGIACGIAQVTAVEGAVGLARADG